ncbi:hypothetical protein ACHQM5_021281 [Ranunculus cassubicifolius]
MKNLCQFSNDLVEEILVRVPVKSLHRSKCVCKGWRDLISRSSFICHITERLKSHPPLVTGVFCTDLVNVQDRHPFNATAKANFLGFGNEMLIESTMDTSLSFLQRPLVPVASHKGLLLCSETPPQCGRDSLKHCVQYLLCNPFTRKWVSLPKPSFNHHVKNVILFCYEKDQCTEFMVLGILDSVPLLDKYCSETGKWNLSNILDKPPKCHVLFNGSVYICADSRHLCVYHLREESTRFVKLPIAQQHTSSQCLGASSELLYYAESDDICLRVWVLIGGVEWALTHRTDYDSLINEYPMIPGYLYLYHLLCFHPSDCNVLLVELDDGYQQVLYHIDKRQTEVMDKIHINSAFPVIPYSLPAWPPRIKNTQ